MSKRQTQSVSPFARKRDRLAMAQTAAPSPGEMAESEGQSQLSVNTPTGPTMNNEDQSIINLLKIIIENQQHQCTPVAPFAMPAYGQHCQCQMPPNYCQTQTTNQSNVPAISEESSIKSLLLTMLQNQTQHYTAQPWSHGPGFFRQPSSLHTCQMHTNFCQHQIQNQSSLEQVPNSATTSTSTATNTKKDELDEPSNRSLIMTLLKNQNKIGTQLEKLLQTQELIAKKLESQSETNLYPVPNKITFKKIDSVKDCHEFEENLKNAEFTQNMMKHFESICGGNSDLYGDNVAYALIDHIFTRRLFTLVTWTGLSRGTESKESFLKFERIFQFFFDLIRRVDQEYGIKSLKDFFQKIISNSKRRFEHKRRRISRVKLSSGLIVKRKKRPIMPAKATIKNYVDVEQETISDEITDNDEDFKDNISTYSNECNTDEVTTNLDIFIKAEDIED